MSSAFKKVIPFFMKNIPAALIFLSFAFAVFPIREDCSSPALIPFQGKRGVMPLRCRGITYSYDSAVIEKILSLRSWNRAFAFYLAFLFNSFTNSLILAVASRIPSIDEA